MVWVPVAVGSDVYALDEWRAFVGHGGDGLLIACGKLHIQDINTKIHPPQCLKSVVGVVELQTGVRRSLVA